MDFTIIRVCFAGLTTVQLDPKSWVINTSATAIIYNSNSRFHQGFVDQEKFNSGIQQQLGFAKPLRISLLLSEN